jgi:hypothetical protein
VEEALELVRSLSGSLLRDEPGAFASIVRILGSHVRPADIVGILHGEGGEQEEEQEVLEGALEVCLQVRLSSVAIGWCFAAAADFTIIAYACQAGDLVEAERLASRLSARRTPRR